jgi:hypothetical protein
MNASGVSWNKGVLDPTGAQMVLTLKLISTAMCLQDFYEKKPQVGPAGPCAMERALTGRGGGRSAARRERSRRPPAGIGAGGGPATLALKQQQRIRGNGRCRLAFLPVPWLHPSPPCLPQDMSPYQRVHHITRLPSLVEFLGYVFCFGNLLAGPIIEFKDYQSFIRRQGLWDPAAPKKVPVLGSVLQVRRGRAEWGLAGWIAARPRAQLAAT